MTVLAFADFARFPKSAVWQVPYSPYQSVVCKLWICLFGSHRSAMEMATNVLYWHLGDSYVQRASALTYNYTGSMSINFNLELPRSV